MTDLAPLAGQVLDGKREVGDLEADEQRALFDFLRRGKVVLFRADPERPDGPSLPQLPQLASPVLNDALERERRRCDRQRGAWLEARDALAAADVPTVLLKSHGPYPYTSSNVDALVPKGALERATEALERAGHREMTHYWEPSKRLLRRFDGPECTVMVHLHDRVSWLTLAFLDMNALWSGARASDDPRVTHPSPEHLVALLLAHSVYESGAVSLGDVWKLRAALGRADFDWSEVTRIARLRGWLPGLALARRWYAAAERAAFGEARLDEGRCLEGLPGVRSRAAAALDRALAGGAWPVALPRSLGRRYFVRKLALDRARGPGRRLWDLWGVALQVVPGRLGLRRRPATFVCICGIDGAGKSTLAAAARAALDECELPSRPAWMRGGYSPAAERLKGALRRSPRVPGATETERKTRAYRRWTTRLGWGALVALEQVLQAVIAVRIPRLRGRAVVAERYVPDTLADLAERFDDPRFAHRMAARALRALTPRPDLVLLLDLSGRAAFARKPDDFDAEVLETRRRLYHRVLVDYARVEVLDAELPLEEIRRRGVDLVLRTALARIRRNPLGRVRRDAWD